MNGRLVKIEEIKIYYLTYLVFLIIFSACSMNEEKSIPENAKDGQLILKQCFFKTKNNKYHADCGSLVVSESRNKSVTRLISLPVILVHSLSKKPMEPVFYLAGGPGQTNMKFKPPDELLAWHDFVLVGYRGVDGSAKLDCPEVRKAIKGKDGDLLGDASLINLNQAFCDCADRLQNEGFDLDSYSILDVIRDMESARIAMGYEKINLLSQSYGTRIAQIYAYQHPDVIHSSVMVGVNPPGRFVWEPETIDRQLDYYGKLWNRDSACRKQTDDLTQTIRNVAQNMPEKWLCFKIDPGKVKLISFALLYNRNTAAQVFETFISASKGDYGGLALMTFAYDFMFPDMITWGDLAAKAISADFDPTRNYAAEMDPPGSVLGSPFSKLLWSLDNWPTKAIPDEYRKVQYSSVSTLLLSGSVDFSTPAEYATDQLLPKLVNGKQVILKEMGHTHDLWNVQRSATVSLITNFFDKGIADDSSFIYAPIDFQISLGFPEIAKIAIVLVLLVPVLLLLIIRSLSKRIVRYKSKKHM